MRESLYVCRWLVLSFFFSSRRRHTRYIGNWSSDVCSSDLTRPSMGEVICMFLMFCSACSMESRALCRFSSLIARADLLERSEERRVGKECRFGGVADY